jgi:putative membrane protein
MNRKPLSRGSAIWSLILIGWAVLILAFLLRGDMLNYLHPRMLPFAALSAVIFLILGMLGGYNAINGRGSNVPRAGYALFMIPLLLSAVGGPRGLDEAAVVNRLLSTGAGVSNKASIESLDQLLESIGPHGVIPFEDWSFFALSTDLKANPSRYVGRTISMTGFSFRPPTLPGDRLYLTRFLITCCAADAEPLGLLTELSGAAGFADYAWLYIEGTLDLTTAPNPYTGKDETVPILRAVTVTEVEKPIAAFIFPVDI